MDEKTFILILDQVKEFSDYIYFHVKGEPLMHPLLGRFLDISHEKGFRVSLATNGILAGKMKDLLLDKPALRQISFSLHSLEGQSDLSEQEKYLDDIFSFALDAVKKTKMFIEFKLWNLDGGTEHDLNAMIIDRMEKRLAVSVKEQEKEAKGKGIRLLNKIYLSRAEKFFWPDMKSPDNHPRGFCYGLKRQAALLVDGTVVPCCLDGQGIMNLGNIHETPFAEIIYGERASSIVRGFSERMAVEELCRKCTYRDRFDI